MRFARSVLLLGLALCAGCSYSARSGMPEHIRTVQVPTVQNKKTFYYGLESQLTKRLIHQVNLDPQVRVVNDGGDAILTVEITDVKKRIYRETKDDRPATVSLTITVKYSFWDEIEQQYIVDEETLTSSETSTSAGLYEVDRGQVRKSAEDTAITALSEELVRRTIGRW